MSTTQQYHSVTELIHEATLKYPEKRAVAVVNGPELTYQEVGQRIVELAQLLVNEGIQPGDRVAIYSENHIHWGICYLAILQAGGVTVPILPDFNPSAVIHIFRHSEAKAAFISPRLIGKLENNPISLLINIDTFHVSKSGSQWQNLIRQGEVALATVRKFARKIFNMEGPLNPDRLAVIIYTSGTTGHSKGVMLSHTNLMANIQSTVELVHISAEDRFLSILPLAHTFECTLGLLTPLSAGSSIYYLEKPPTAPVLLPALQVVRPTVMLSVPLVIEKIYKSKIVPAFHEKFVIRKLYGLPFFRKMFNKKAGQKLKETFGGQLRMFCIGGAALASDAEFFLREAGFPYAIGYGLTETSPLVTGTTPSETRYKSAGKPISRVQVKIDHPDSVTGIGEVWIKGPNVMLGYYRDPEKTADVLTNDGWFHSGDLGKIDSDGFLFIRGRSKNMILGPSGENIYPEELEALLNEHEWVAESLVLEDGKQIVARVFLNYEVMDKDLGADAINESEARKRISAFLDELKSSVNARSSKFAKLTTIIEQPEPFEKTPTQKIKRYLYTSKPLNGMSQS